MKLLLFIFSVLISSTGFAKSYNLSINEKTVSFSGEERKAMAVNDSIPGPTLTFTEGDTGSPGMDYGSHKEKFTVLSFDKDGATSAFEEFN